MDTMYSVYRSADIDKIMGALAKAQGSYKELVPSGRTSRGKFALLRDILAATKEALSANGLALFHYVELLDEGSGAALLKTMLCHESGQFISSFSRIIHGSTERQTGNIYEIHRRRHTLLVLGIAPLENDPYSFDDDGEELADVHLMKEMRKPDNPAKDALDRNDVITSDQYNDLIIELDGLPKLAKDILEAYGIDTLADLPRSEYYKARSKILKIKRTEEEYGRKR
jgi:hypothetical protein